MDHQVNLKDEVRAMLEARRGDWPTIAKDAKVSYSWVVQFAGRKIDNPSYDRLCNLRAVMARGMRTKKQEAEA